ncbi:hypothetical protein RUM43_011804 [Polyplax serrata]|uniref:Uncharacterized protein n=1 Tax=Polyplax serrata TaxID=468196 RepID=A0AAN8P6I2_POLSC
MRTSRREERKGKERKGQRDGSVSAFKRWEEPIIRQEPSQKGCEIFILYYDKLRSNIEATDAIKKNLNVDYIITTTEITKMAYLYEMTMDHGSIFRLSASLHHVPLPQSENDNPTIDWTGTCLEDPWKFEPDEMEASEEFEPNDLGNPKKNGRQLKEKLPNGATKHGPNPRGHLP